MDIRLPRLGEGADTGSVVSVLVKVGDKVKKDQTILELENEKAVAPIPSPVAGTVSKIHVKEGDKISVGQLIASLAEEGASAQAEAAPAAGPRVAEPRPAAAAPQGSAAAGDYQYQSKSGFPPPASPEIRKMAKQLGIDLTRVQGSEHGGRITLDDFRNYIARLQQGGFAAEVVDFSKWGKVSKKPVSSLRKTIGQKMHESWAAIPHVTQFDEVDITELLALRKKHKAAYEKKGANLTLTGFAIKAVVQAIKKYPVFASSLEVGGSELVYKEYIHVGIAVDTEQGLIVPVIRDADKKSLFDLSVELAKLAEKTRQRKVSIDELKGGCFTISNLGGIGGTHFTPIVNKPEVAILGIGKAVTRPVLVEKKFEPRMMLPVALSYDHRVIDGADGARFITEIVQAFANFKESEVKIK